MKKRIMAIILSLCMMVSLLPMSALATDYSDSNPLPADQSYQVGDTYTGTQKPEAPPKTVWVQSGAGTKVLICKYKDLPSHPHTADCEPSCDHREGHTIDCYDSGDANWVNCTQENCTHYEDGKHVLYVGDGCWNKTGLQITKLFYLLLTLGQSYPTWIDTAIKIAGDGFIHLEVKADATPKCNHGDNHTDACYPKDDKHPHTDDCYATQYTWILKADKNGDNIPDDQQTFYTVTYTDGVAGVEVFEDQTTGNLLVGDTTPTFTGSTERTDYVFAGWTPAFEEKVAAPAEGTTITYTATWKDDKNNNGVADEDETKYTVTYTDGVAGAEVFEDQKKDDILFDTIIPDFTGTPTRSGYSFEKWTWYKAGADDKPTGDPFEKKPANMPAYNLIAVAQWKENGGGPSHTTKYTLTYETNGGSKIDSERYTSGSTAKLTKTPVRENYTFTGWYEDEGMTKKITEIKMNSNKIVYAGWEATEVPGMLNGNDHFAYVIGYPDGNVKPMGNITRAEVATIFFRLLKDDVRDGNLTTTNVFNDVNEGNWFNTAISTMAKLGIVNGRTADTFAPNAPITRAEFAAICARFDTSIDMGASSFTDIDGHWAKDNIEHAVSLGWIMGYEDNTFRPNNLITRAEAMTMINRVLCRMPEVPEDLLSDMNIWPDNSDTSKWYYLPIQEATNSHDFKKKGEIYEAWTTLTDDPDWSRYQN